MRTIDRLTAEDYKIPSIQLMQNAAEACFLEIGKLVSGKFANLSALVLCGPGNNGGDAAALAVKLAQAKTYTDVILFASLENTRGDARTNFEGVKKLSAQERGANPLLSFVECHNEMQWEALSGTTRVYDLIIDGLFGTGLSRPLQGLFASVVEQIHNIQTGSGSGSRPPVVFSVDLPSGLNSDLSQPIGPAMNADATVTFTAPKVANVLPPAAHLNGKLTIAGIGSPKELVESQPTNLFLVERDDVQAWLRQTRYAPESYKNTHGRVLIIGGSRGYTGAAVLCGNAAMRSGAGLVTIATPASAQLIVASTVLPEVMTTPLAETDRGAVSDEAIEHVKRLASHASVVAIGPGLSAEDERTRLFVYSVVKDRTTPVVIDADGLNCLAPWPNQLLGSSDAPIVLTPHVGEMKRLLGVTDEIEFDDRVELVRDFAAAHHLVVALKGSRTLIATPEKVFINPTGNAGLGTAGSGDTLTGIIAGFIAQAATALKGDVEVLEAVVAAVFVGGFAGDLAAQDIGMRGMIASDISSHLSAAFRSLDPEGETPSRLATS